MLGSIQSIETLTSVDGPGVRVVVFMSGCKKRCLYCHNPEMFKMIKPNYSVFDLTEKLLRYKNYFRRGGGVTFSGGEPLLQCDYLIEVFKELKKEKIHIAIDTAGDFKGNIRELLKYVDLVILDIKHIFKDEYENLCKVSIDKVEEFIHILNESRVLVDLRQVIVPGIHDNLEYIKSLKEYIKKIKNVNNITFIPYHKLGMEKYQELGLIYPLKDTIEMDKDKCNSLYQEFLNLEK